MCNRSRQLTESLLRAYFQALSESFNLAFQGIQEIFLLCKPLSHVRDIDVSLDYLVSSEFDDPYVVLLNESGTSYRSTQGGQHTLFLLDHLLATVFHLYVSNMKRFLARIKNTWGC